MITSRPDRIAVGVTLIVVSVFMMSIQDGLFKYFSADLSLWQTFSLRGVFVLPLLYLIAFSQGVQRLLWQQSLTKWPMLRSLYMTMMFVAMYASTPFLSLSTIAAGIYTAPVFVTLMSAYVIGEPVGNRGWVAIIMGFVGVLIILQPGTDAFSLWAILPVLGGFLYALSNVTTRSKCQNISVTALTLSLNLVLLFTGIAMSLVLLLWQPSNEMIATHPFVLDEWSAMRKQDWMLILLFAAFAVAIGLGLAAAYKSAPPSIVATFDYSYLIFVVLWDTLFFSGTPTSITMLGILLIVSSGLLILRRR